MEFRGLRFWVWVRYCPPPPPPCDSWIILIIWPYLTLNRTPNIDCDWVGAVPKVSAFRFKVYRTCVRLISPVSVRGFVLCLLALWNFHLFWVEVSGLRVQGRVIDFMGSSTEGL